MNAKDLKKMQKIQREILSAVHNFCESNDIKYQVYAGTLLGAVRHKDFIPWDDDIDIAMLREDYDKFLNLTQGSIGDNYFVQNYRTEKEFPTEFTKVRKNNTLAMEYWFRDLDIHQGVWIDVFPLDAYPSSKIKQWLYNIQLNFGKFVRRLFYFKDIKTSNKVKNLIKFFVNVFLSFLNKNMVDNLTERNLTKYNGKGEKLCTSLTMKINKANCFTSINTKSSYEDLTKYKFGELMVYGPKDYDKFLSKFYGNYMELPPIEKRKPGHVIIEFKSSTSQRRGV